MFNTEGSWGDPPLIIMSVSVLMVAVASILVFWAAHAERLLDGHLLPAQLHGVHQVVNVIHDPHGSGVPGLDVAILPDEQHGEVFWAYLEVVPHVIHQSGREPFTVHGGTPWTDQRVRLETKNSSNAFSVLRCYH